MKYDYFEREAGASLYRVPFGLQKPVQFVLAGRWTLSKTYANRGELVNDHESYIKQITTTRAKELSQGSTV